MSMMPYASLSLSPCDGRPTPHPNARCVRCVCECVCVKYDFHRTARRYYRNTLQVLESAIDEWNKHPLVCIVQMGDLLDGFCHRGADPRVALATVRKTQERAVCKSWHNVIGNHELYNFDRAELRELLNVHYGGATDYYSFSPYAGWRIVILDAYDISIIGRDKESPEYKEALTILQSNNPNNVLEFVDWIQGLEGTQRRFLPYNGSMSQAQLTWLDRTLADATAANERVIVVSHVPLHLCCCGVRTRTSMPHGLTRSLACSMQPTVLVWNYEEVLRVLHRYHCVAAVLYGHEHKGGRGVDEHGIHHIIFEAPLECPPGETALYVSVSCSLAPIHS